MEVKDETGVVIAEVEKVIHVERNSKMLGKPKHQELLGVRVLVGRAHHKAGALSSELRKLGATVLEIPFIEIRKPRSFRPLDSALQNLDAYDWLILTSANGVEAMWERLAKLHLTKRSQAPKDRGHRPGNQESDRAARRQGRCCSQGICGRVCSAQPAAASKREEACCWCVPRSPAM